MAYCDICNNYDDEHTDGEPSMKIGNHYKPLLDYFYSLEVMGEDYCDYDWSHIKGFDEVTCMCQLCFNSYDRLGKIKWKCNQVDS